MRRLALAPLVLALLAGPALAEEAPTVTPYGAELEGFDYPHPLRRFAFASQGQDLAMGYMDVAPQGEANGRTAVLLHGKNFCGATWERQIADLSEAGFRVVVPDQVGFCTSTKPKGYQFSLNQLAANTHALLQSLGIAEASVVGHSMGGMLASRYALMYPEATERLVLVNPIGLENWQAKGVPYQTIDEAYQGELKTDYASIRAYQQKIYYGGRWKPAYDRWVLMLAGQYAGPGREAVARNQAETSDMVYTNAVIAEFNRIAVPTTLIIGQKDKTAPGANRAPKEIAASLGDYPRLGRAAAELIPDSVLVELKDLGHSPQVEAPDVFQPELLKALGHGETGAPGEGLRR